MEEIFAACDAFGYRVPPWNAGRIFCFLHADRARGNTGGKSHRCGGGNAPAKGNASATTDADIEGRKEPLPAYLIRGSRLYLRAASGWKDGASARDGH